MSIFLNDLRLSDVDTVHWSETNSQHTTSKVWVLDSRSWCFIGRPRKKTLDYCLGFRQDVAIILGNRTSLTHVYSKNKYCIRSPNAAALNLLNTPKRFICK